MDFLPDLIESVPAGRQSSPGRKNRKMVFSGNVWKYSPSSTYLKCTISIDDRVKIIL